MNSFKPTPNQYTYMFQMNNLLWRLEFYGRVTLLKVDASIIRTRMANVSKDHT